MIKKIREILEKIGDGKTNSTAEYIEFRRLQNWVANEEWRLKSSSEKQLFRKRLLTATKNYRGERHPGDFIYEHTMIEFYNAALEFVRWVDENQLTDQLLNRFYFQLQLDINRIDEYPTLRPKGVVPFEVYEMLDLKLKESKFECKSRVRIMDLVEQLRLLTPPSSI